MHKSLGALLTSASLLAIVSTQLVVVSPGPALAASTGAGGKGGDSVPGGSGGAGGVGTTGAAGVAGSTGAGGGGGAAGGGVGGNGGDDGGLGGAGGAPGGAGAAGAGDGGGGGGGGGLNGQTGGALAAATGIAGGAGGASTAVLHQPGGGGGGAGGFGISDLATGGTNTFTIVGGVGGAGGAGPMGGYGGTGGAGLSSATALTITNTGTITGGAGGAGGAGTVLGGNGGDGGDAIAASNLTLVNNGGTITGGAAGAAGAGGGSAGTGGAAIAGANLTLTNAGTLAGGSGANAVVFTGGTNSLTLQSGSIITGNAVAFSTADTLALGGATNAAFDVSNIGPAAQYRGFGIFGKTGSSTWTLSGTTAFSGSTLISGGTLALSGAASIANSNVTDNAIFDISGTTSGTSIAGLTGSGLTNLGSKTLTISNGSGTYSGTTSATAGGITISGGAATFSNVLAYTGATAISGGTLKLTGAGSIASSSGLADAGTFDISGTTSGATLAALTGGGTVALGSQTLTLNAGAFSGVIGGSGNLVIAGTTTTLSGINTYNGTTSIGAGTLALSGSGTIGTSGSLTNLGTFDISQTTAGTSLKSLSGTGPVALGSKTLTLTAAGGTYAGAFQDGGLGGGAGGSLAVTGGTQILTGNSTYTGTTIIGPGAVLQIGDNGATGNLGSGAVTSNGTLAYYLSVPRTVSNVISGTGGLTQGGTGVLTVTAPQSYTGITAINGGRTLALSGAGDLASSSVADAGIFDISGTTTGAAVASLSGIGSVALGSKTLTIANGTGTFDGIITDGGIAAGTGGRLTVNGGTEILSGTNTYTGITTIGSGATIQVGTGGTNGTLGSGDVTDNGTLVFNRSDTVNYLGSVSGSGGLTQSGNGNLILAGTNGYTGPTMVSAGTLSVNGSIASSPVTVASGAKLGGIGTVGPTSIASGGILAPGNSIGTMAVNGDLSLPAGSIYQVELSPTAADRTNVTGTATLGGTLQLFPSTGTYVSGTDYKLINAGLVLNTFSTVTGAVPGFTNTVQYSATGVDLILGSPPDATPPTGTPPASPPGTPPGGSGTTSPPAIITTYLFGTYGNTPNQIAAGNALAAGSYSGSLYDAVGGVVRTNATAVPSALGQLAGDIHASVRSAAIEDSRLIRNTVLDHLARPADAVTLWGAGFGGYGSIAADGNASGVHHENAGAMLGADIPIDDALRVGIAAAYSSNNARSTDFNSGANGSMGHIIAYAGWTQDAIDLRAGGVFGWGAAQVTRNVTAIAQTLTDHQRQQSAQLFADAGYKLSFDAAMVEPYIGVAHIAAASGSFTEAGGTAALSGSGKTDTQTYSTLGLRAFENGLMLGDMVITPRADVAWQHAFGRFLPGQTVTLLDAGQSFAVLGTPLATDVAAVQAGFDLAIRPGTTLFIAYDGSFSSTVQNNALRGGINWAL